MAFGEPVGDLREVQSGQVLEIRPLTGEAWMIFNIYVPNGVANFELYVSDGVNDTLIDVSNVSWINCRFVLTENHFLKVKNTATTSQFIGYDGIKLK